MLAGKKDEFRTLVLRYQEIIFYLLLKQVRDRQTAEELTQDTFIRAYKGLRGFGGRSSLRTWLTRISLNVANNYFSSRAFREQLRNMPYTQELHEADEQTADTGEAPDFSSKILIQALGELPPKYREPLVLCRIEKRSYAETGVLLGIPPGTVCSRINTALALLRKQLIRQER